MWKDDRKSNVYSQDTFFSEVKTFHSVFHSLLGEKKNKNLLLSYFPLKNEKLERQEWRKLREKNKI